MSDELIAVHLEYGATVPNYETGTLLCPLNGACGNVATDATAFPYRDADYAVVLGPVASYRGTMGDWSRSRAVTTPAICFGSTRTSHQTPRRAESPPLMSTVESQRTRRVRRA
jgi:hypothetical protein